MDLFLSEEEAVQAKEKILKDKMLSEMLTAEADKKLGGKLYSVTDCKSPAASKNPHDYFSEGPYWWPDPKNPDGPYIRRDGETNPERFEAHSKALSGVSKDSYCLASAGYVLDNKKYTERACQLLNRFFVDEETAMNPHLEYGQAIRGICNGRPIGIIDSTCLISAAQAVWFLDKSGCDTGKVKEWFADYLNWLETSETGLGEKFYHNNHANWYNTQAMAYAAITDNKEIFDDTCSMFREKIIPEQLSAECSFPDELSRTKSYGYSCFSLQATAIACEIAYHSGVDLYHFETPDGKGFEKAVDFMFPYLKNPFDWKYRQISGDVETAPTFLQIGGYRLGRQDWLSHYRSRRKNRLPFIVDYCYPPLMVGYFEKR